MLKVFVHGGPNPRKITILLEELGWPYEWELVDMYEGQHVSPSFLKVNPNGRLPALVDRDGPEGEIVLWESGAMLQYLADKSGQFMPLKGAQRYEVLKWLNFQVTHAPYLGQAHLYRIMYREAFPFDIKRFTLESSRIYAVLETQLKQCQYVAGESYSIADIAWYPWIEYHEWQGQKLSDYPAIKRWFQETGKRPAVARGRSIPWAYGDFGPSAAGKRAGELVARRLKDPAFTLIPEPSDAALANLAN
jgi:GST-like protein